jgi:hypothetical protein
LLDLVPSVPPMKWGRDERRTGDMWNSNSVVSWLLTRSGLPAEHIQPPRGGRAPGWTAGVEIARRDAAASHGPLPAGLSAAGSVSLSWDRKRRTEARS